MASQSSAEGSMTWKMELTMKFVAFSANPDSSGKSKAC